MFIRDNRMGQRARGRRWPCALAALALVAAVPARAMADTPQETEALSYVKAGKALYDAGDYAAALDAFQKARSRAPHKPVPYLWVARSLIRLGRCDEAAGTAKAFGQRVAPDDLRRAELDREQAGCARRAADAQPAPEKRPLPVVDKSPARPEPGKSRKGTLVGGIVGGVLALGLGVGLGLGFGLRGENIAETALGPVDFR